MNFEPTTPTARLALDTILQKPVKGIPTWLIHVMDHAHIERLAHVPPGTYVKDPEATYLAMERAFGVCLLDQYLWDNPLTMGYKGYEGGPRSATTGIRYLEKDGIVIDSAEAVVEHLEKFAFPKLKTEIETFDEDARAREIVDHEQEIQQRIGPTMLKSGYSFVRFPCFAYTTYGYENYFCAYAHYPEIMEKHFALQADVAVLNNRAAARAYKEACMPPMYRLDHDMADSRGTLVSIQSLDRIWFPHFARSIEPLVKAGVKLIWHCDGNLMQMLPRLLDCGVRGFQGFQYEVGMDYERICRMRSRDGDSLIIIAGVSVTRTLPVGKPEDVKRELKWLVECGPKTGLFLGCSSSVAPGVPWENIETLREGLLYYQKHGRTGVG